MRAAEEAVTGKAVVVGGGYAGLIAARDLSHAGHEVVIFEARDRLGGRALYGDIPQSDKKVDYGGAWFSYDLMEPLRREIDRYNIGFVEDDAPERYAWFTDNVLRKKFPVPLEELAELEQCLLAFADAARLVAKEGASSQERISDISVAAWLDQIKAPPATRDFIASWIAIYAGADLSEVSFLFICNLLAPFNGALSALFLGLSHKFSNGADSLAAALAKDVRGQIEFSTAVSEITEYKDGVRVALNNREPVDADAVIVTVPINTLPYIGFSPSPSGALYRLIREGQPCIAIKFWALARNMPSGLLATGAGASQWISSAAHDEDTTLVVGFGYDPDKLSIDDPQSVAAAIKAYVPDAELISCFGHDWVSDPWSRGAWAVWRPGWASERMIEKLHFESKRVIFAGADYALEWSAWIAGAIHSGAAAAVRATQLVK